LDAETLAARIAQLEAEVGRHQVQHQQLATAKDRIDRELQRFKTIQHYVQQAVLAESLNQLNELTLEAIIEAFEFEVALFLTWDGQLAIAHAFGFEQDLPATLPFDQSWVGNGGSRILKGDDPVLGAWSELGLSDAILAPLSDKNGALCGIVLGGRTVARGKLYDEGQRGATFIVRGPDQPGRGPVPELRAVSGNPRTQSAASVAHSFL
jgi:hypothetical protein